MSPIRTPPDAPAPVATLRALRRAAFTLVEMLVVVLLIAVLAGMIFKLTGLAGDKTAKATTLARLERLKTAVEEFYAEYGQYPPVPLYNGTQPFFYEYAHTNYMDSRIASMIANNDASRVPPLTWEESWTYAPAFTFGLMSFLVRRYGGRGEYCWGELRTGGSQWGDHNSDAFGDQPRDSAAVDRWMPFLQSDTDESFFREGIGPLRRCGNPDTGAGYTNMVLTVWDGWYRDFHYQSDPPHQTYKIFSAGPDGNAETTGDNIEGHAGH